MSSPTETILESMIQIIYCPYRQKVIDGEASFADWEAYLYTLVGGVVIYVDYDNGDDTNGGRSPDDAYKTVQAALDAVVPGSIVQILSKTNRVTQSLELSVSGLPNAPVRIQGPEDGNAVILGSVSYDDWEPAPEFGPDFWRHSFVDLDGNPIPKNRFSSKDNPESHRTRLEHCFVKTDGESGKPLVHTVFKTDQATSAAHLGHPDFTWTAREIESPAYDTEVVALDAVLRQYPSHEDYDLNTGANNYTAYAETIMQLYHASIDGGSGYFIDYDAGEIIMRLNGADPEDVEIAYVQHGLDLRELAYIDVRNITFQGFVPGTLDTPLGTIPVKSAAFIPAEFSNNSNVNAYQCGGSGINPFHSLSLSQCRAEYCTYQGFTQYRPPLMVECELRFNSAKGHGWNEAAGAAAKIVDARDGDYERASDPPRINVPAIIDSIIVEKNAGEGFWFDGFVNNTVVRNSRFVKNFGTGFYHEISGRWRANLVTGCYFYKNGKCTDTLAPTPTDRTLGCHTRAQFSPSGGGIICAESQNMVATNNIFIQNYNGVFIRNLMRDTEVIIDWGEETEMNWTIEGQPLPNNPYTLNDITQLHTDIIAAIPPGSSTTALIDGKHITTDLTGGELGGAITRVDKLFVDTAESFSVDGPTHIQSFFNPFEETESVAISHNAIINNVFGLTLGQSPQNSKWNQAGDRFNFQAQKVVIDYNYYWRDTVNHPGAREIAGYLSQPPVFFYITDLDPGTNQMTLEGGCNWGDGDTGISLRLYSKDPNAAAPAGLVLDSDYLFDVISVDRDPVSGLTVTVVQCQTNFTDQGSLNLELKQSTGTGGSVMDTLEEWKLVDSDYSGIYFAPCFGHNVTTADGRDRPMKNIFDQQSREEDPLVIDAENGEFGAEYMQKIALPSPYFPRYEE